MKIETIPIDAVTEDPANTRKHGERNLYTIAGSLKRFGQVEPLVVQRKTGQVIGGNGRLRVMRELGWEKVSVVKVDIDDTQAAALSIALNRTAELADWDKAALHSILTSFDAELLDAVGFDEYDVSALDWEPLPPDDAIEPDEDSTITLKVDGVKRADAELVERTVNESLGPLGLGLKVKVLNA